MPRSNLTVLALSLVLGAAATQAALAADKRASPRAGSDAERRYQEERAACSALQGDERRTCLREAGAARQEARRGGLSDEQATYEKNLLARCGYLKDDDRSDCERRMRGEGTTSGSVAGGGIYRELRTVVPDDEPAATGGSAR